MVTRMAVAHFKWNDPYTLQWAAPIPIKINPLP